jgi:hypothetical protein
MTSLTKKLTCGTAAFFMLAAATVPAEARGRHHHHDEDVDAGDVIGTAILLGGLAAIVSASKNYGGSYSAERKAVKACVREVERGGSRYDAARVGDVTGVERQGRYYLVRGVLQSRERYDYPGAPPRDAEAQVQTAAQEDFTCTVRGKRIYAFNRSGGYHW